MGDTYLSHVWPHPKGAEVGVTMGDYTCLNHSISAIMSLEFHSKVENELIVVR